MGQKSEWAKVTFQRKVFLGRGNEHIWDHEGGQKQKIQDGGRGGVGALGLHLTQ